MSARLAVSATPIPGNYPPAGWPDDVTWLRALMDLMREKRVTKLSAFGANLEMHADAWAPAQPSPSAPAPEAPACPCGHAPYEHGDAGCLVGCPHEDCARRADGA